MPCRTTPLYLAYASEALEGVVHRIVAACPPTVDDFRSYEALGKRYDRRDFFKGTGVSMHTSRTTSLRIARTYGVGDGIATLDLRGTSVAWARTGGANHITVWAPPEHLLARVVECVDHG